MDLGWGRVRRWRGLAGLVVLLVLVVSATPAWGEVRRGDAFEHDYNWYLDQGTGDYAGYTETMLSQSRYEISQVSGNEASVSGSGSWTWQASDGSYDSGSYPVDFAFSTVTRRYTRGTDLEGVYVDPAVWFWVQTPIVLGSVVKILDDFFDVQSVSETYLLGSSSRPAALLVATGTYVRDDVYGRFDVTYTDRYLFDLETGYVLSESYEEFDTSPQATFRMRADILVSVLSIAPLPVPIDWSLIALVAAAIVVAVVAVSFGAWRLSRGPSRLLVSTAAGPVPVTIRRARRVSAFSGLRPEASSHFDPFLLTFARRSLNSGDPVVTATAGDRLVGLLTYDGESALGSLFTLDGGVARVLLKRVRVSDFFAEFQGSPGDLPAEPVDSFKILERKNLEPVPYDPQVVRPMAPQDLPWVIAIAEEVYRGRASRWVESCYQDGDIAFVATFAGQVVGFGFATVADSVGRLHTLTVLPGHRSRGVGSELTAARLSALAALQVDRVITEISKNNAPSLRIAAKAGFEVVGETIYYSREPRSSALAFQRQF